MICGTETNDHIVIHAPAENIKCPQCGMIYFSKGKRDPGICPACVQNNYIESMKGGSDNDK